MKKHFLIGVIIVLPFSFFAQTNLVPNPSFELNSACPSNWNQRKHPTKYILLGNSNDC